LNVRHGCERHHGGLREGEASRLDPHLRLVRHCELRVGAKLAALQWPYLAQVCPYLVANLEALAGQDADLCHGASHVEAKGVREANEGGHALGFVEYLPVHRIDRGRVDRNQNLLGPALGNVLGYELHHGEIAGARRLGGDNRLHAFCVRNRKPGEGLNQTRRVH
jgi:hypothetical protein